MERENIDLLSDQAVTTKENDKFNRSEFVETVAKIIHSQTTQVNPENNPDYKNIEENMTIGLYGSWGSGKSSIVNLLDENLKGKNIETHFFNPWMYKNESELILSLFQLIQSKLDDSLKNKFKGLLSKYQPYISAVVSIPSSGLGKHTKEIIESLKEQDPSDPIETKKEIDQLLVEKANPQVIFIDDVDRLSRDEIQVLFKTLRLIASFKNVIYVIACDIDMVAKSIKDNYAGGHETDGYAFIEKIIQIPIRVPNINDDELYNYGVNYIKANLELETVSDILFTKLFKRYLRTPRDVKRFINGFLFTFYQLKNSIQTIQLINLEIIRVKAPELYKLIEFYYDSIISPNPKIQYENNILAYIKSLDSNCLNPDNNLNYQYGKVKDYAEVWNILFGMKNLDKLRFGDNGKSEYAVHLLSNEIKKLKTFKNPNVLKLYFEMRKAIDS